VGFNPTRYQYRALEAEGEQVRARIGHATQSWGEAEWLERGEWVEGQRIHGMRRYVAGPLREGGFLAELAPAGDGTRASLIAYVDAATPLDARIEARITGVIEQALKHYVDSLEQLLTRAREQGRLGTGPGPAVIQANRLLGWMEPEGSTFGLRSPVQEEELKHRAQRLTGTPILPEVRERVIQLAREAFDEELRQIRPFELARGWGLARREVLRGFLYAAKAGLYELQWQLECPMCRQGAQDISGLENVRREGYCVDCDRSFSLDFASNVEAIFRVSPAIRAVSSADYCAGSPSFRPHIFANFIVPAHGRREVSLVLPPGNFTIRTTMLRFRTGLPAHPGSRLQVKMTPATLEVTPEEHGVSGGSPVSLVLVNDTAHEEEFSLERADYAPEAALGRDVLSMPDFHDLFATEAPATGMELSIGSMTVLFSDLTGSTALYEQIGDARAFALIEQHFRLAAQAVARHGGAVLKTMGDAVMATFPRAGDAFAAALEMVRETERLHGHHGLRLKTGLHEGPCLAVRANQRLDLFGTTVNLAARLQAKARGGQVVMLERLFQHPEIAQRIQRERLDATRFEAELRGVSERQSCVSVVVS
jgi:class 3 adenylate cyclase